MMRTFIYRASIVMLCVILTILGIYIGLQIFENNIKEDTVNVINNSEKQEDENTDEQVEIYNNTPVISKTYDIELVYEDYYELCKESIINKNIIYGVTLDELKKSEIEKQEKLGEKYEIVEESNERLVFKRTINKYCPNHFILTLNNEQNEVVIYSVEDNEMTTLYKTIEVYKNTLREELVEELENGIEVNSVKELKLIIEDIES